MTKICIYGAGSVGCYIGGRLLAGGSAVTFVGRERTCKLLRTHGLTVSDFGGRRWSVPPERIEVSTDRTTAASADLLLVTTKSSATHTVATELAGVLSPNTIVVSFQNGIGNADVLRSALPRNLVLEGMVPFNVAEQGEGAFHQGSSGILKIRRAPRLRSFVSEFEKAGLSLTLHTHMLPVQWAKLLLNLNNSINALSNRPLKEELAHHAYRVCLGMAQKEALVLLAQAGIRPARLSPIPIAWTPAILGLPDRWFGRVGRAMLTIDPLARSSMSDDLAAGRKTEIDWINGEVVRLAQCVGRRAPVNERLCELVRQAEQSETRPSWSGDRLLADLRVAAVRGSA